ncbi:MAG: hypothetical protein ACI9ZF_000646 [Bradyrhizobium sp.]|jgi:hypothetical protein
MRILLKWVEKQSARLRLRRGGCELNSTVRDKADLCVAPLIAYACGDVTRYGTIAPLPALHCALICGCLPDTRIAF